MIDIKLSSGRTVTRRPMDNGASEIVPTTGYNAITQAESDEYHAVYDARFADCYANFKRLTELGEYGSWVFG